MGQAKQRGTFEQRVAESVQRKTEEGERRRLEQAEQKKRQLLRDARFPEEARRRHRSLSVLATAAVLAASMTNR
jgi:hypothetical protein